MLNAFYLLFILFINRLMHVMDTIVMATNQIPLTNQHFGQKIGMDGMLYTLLFCWVGYCFLDVTFVDYCLLFELERR